MVADLRSLILVRTVLLFYREQMQSDREAARTDRAIPNILSRAFFPTCVSASALEARAFVSTI